MNQIRFEFNNYFVSGVISLLCECAGREGMTSGTMFKLSGIISGTVWGVLTVHWSNRDAFLDKSAIDVQNNRYWYCAFSH